MKKTLKKILFTFIAAVTVCSFAACGDDEGENSPDGGLSYKDELPYKFSVQRSYTGQDFESVHNRLLNLGCKHGARIWNDDDEFEFIEYETEDDCEMHYYTYNDNTVFSVDYNTVTGIVYGVGWSYHGSRKTCWDEFKAALDDENSFSAGFKLEEFNGSIFTADDEFYFDSKQKFLSAVPSYSYNRTEEAEAGFGYSDHTSAMIWYAPSIYGDYSIQKYYYNYDMYYPEVKSAKRIHAWFNEKDRK